MNSIGEEYLRAVSAWLWETSWQSTLLAAVVLVVQWVLRRQLSARWRSALWLLVLARLLLPALPHTRFSAYNWLPIRHHAAPPAMTSAPPHPAQGITATFHSAPTLVAFPGATLTYPGEALPHEPLMLRTPGTSAPTASPAPSSPLPLLPLIWMAGCVAISAYTIAVYLRLGRKVNRLRVETPEGLRKQFMDAKAELKVSRADLIVSEAVSTPFVTGFWKARVVLPTGLEAKLSFEDIRMVLLHELAHVKRGDLWMTWLSWLAATLHWFNPGIRYVLALARKDREMACDEWVLRLVEDAKAYGAALIRFMELNQSPTPAPGFGAIGIFEGKSALLQRIRRIATYRRPTLLASLIGFAVLLVVGLFTLTNASDQPSPSADMSHSQARPPTRDLEADLAALQKAIKSVGMVDHHATQVLAGNYMYSRDPRARPFDDGNVRLVTPDGYHFVVHDYTSEATMRAKTEFKHFSPFLYRAIEQGDAEVLRELLKDGAVPNRPENDESHLFAPDGDPVIERPAPKVGPVREIRVREDKRPLFEPLEAAVNSLTQAPNDEKRRQILQLLLRYGANPNPKLANHSSVLYAPVANDMVELVKFLLDAGIDPRKDADGGRALSEQVERHGSNEMKNLIKTALEGKAEVLASGADRLAAAPRTVVLDAPAAARLAASLANSEAKRQVDAAPFKPSQDTPTLSEGRWLWRATVGYGKGDLQAVVSFTKTGADAQVHLQTLIFAPPIAR